jgi:hypothetical protein
MLECDEASRFIGECGLSGPVDGVADQSGLAADTVTVEERRYL